MKFLTPEMLHRLTKIWMPVGKRVVIIGGLINGCELAEFLVHRGRKVTILEESDQLGTGMPEVKRIRLLSWLAEKSVTLMTGVKYEAILDKGVSISSVKGGEQTIPADTILVAMPLKPDTESFKTLEGKIPEVYRIGDCGNPGLIVDAIAEGSSIGRKI